VRTAITAGDITTIAVRTTTGSFTVPAGVTRMYAYVTGAGGGGAAGNQNSPSRGQPQLNFAGGTGGRGGAAFSILTVTPNDVINYTIGAGGAGNNGGAGSSGGSTTIGTITCTGGTGGSSATTGSNGASGTDGTGSGGNLTNGTYIDDLLPLLQLGDVMLDDAFALTDQAPSRARATSSTAAILYAYPGDSTAGAGGQGELTSSGNNAAGGVSGAVIFMY
jgi:hypothetical protein